jgi:diacylglycerol kinase (ATP)
MRALLVHNPAAGGGRSGRLLPDVLARLRAVGIDPEPYRTSSLQDATAAARKAAGSMDAVLAMGGDGTVGACAAGLATAPAATAALGVIPAGGGNDAARNLGLPHADPIAAATLLPTYVRRRIDLVRTGELFVLNAAGAGFDAEVSRISNRRLSWAPSLLRYAGGVLAELAVGRAARFRLRLDDQVIETSAWLVAVANSQSYGGGMRIAPAAMLDDGLLDVVIVSGELSKAGFLRTFPKVFSGRHVEHPAVSCHRAREVTLEADADRPVAVHVDGEPAGIAPASFEVVASAIAVLAGERPPALSALSAAGEPPAGEPPVSPGPSSP